MKRWKIWVELIVGAALSFFISYGIARSLNEQDWVWVAIGFAALLTSMHLMMNAWRQV